MPQQSPPIRNAPETDYKAIAARFAAAKRAKEAEDEITRQKGINGTPTGKTSYLDRQQEALEARRKTAFERKWAWTAGFWLWMLCIHALGIAYFTSGFLLTRLVLDEKSSCAVNPVPNAHDQATIILPDWDGRGTVEGGCWHPKTFDRAVVILIDALRYDFTIPTNDNDDKAEYHNALPFLYNTALERPTQAFLRPFIADPPTTTLQRLKGLTTGTLPTFIDMGSNFAGTAIEEDNLLMQLKDAGKKVVHLGDDTWESLFPGYFEANISRAYDSFNVWDLHSVDEGVLEHIFPLMKPERHGEWDVVIGHLLGVDHAGHRYGPAHTAMTSKLRQMDKFIAELVATITDDTLLIVMGDHGMDSKGDHGGESDDEIEAALWMYSSRPVFGRTQAEYTVPPATAKERPVNQIDLVSTFALLLGLPIPYNNLGAPIEEAFAGVKGAAWDRLAAAASVTAAQIKRYQASYFAARGIAEDVSSTSPSSLYMKARGIVESHKFSPDRLATAYHAFNNYQAETLRICKGLWARFDVPSMVIGIVITALGLAVLLLYVLRDNDDDLAEVENDELDAAERKLEATEGVQVDLSDGASSRTLLLNALLGLVPGALVGAALAYATGAPDYRLSAAVAGLFSTIAVVTTLVRVRDLTFLIPTTTWSWLSVAFTLSQSLGFAANSFTIWEDSILHYFITTFGFATALASFNLPSKASRLLGVYHSTLFIVLGRIASFSKLCRDEQMPYCISTYYASSTSSTSATWQLAIPFAVFALLPFVIKSYYTPTRSYEGLAPSWIGYVLRVGLFMSAIFWVIDTADNDNWLPDIPEGSLKTFRVYLAQIILALALVAGTTAFTWASPCVAITTITPSSSSTATRQHARVTVLGYANAHGARYLFLPINILGACILLSKPMGGGALALFIWQIMSLIEILDVNDLVRESIGPVMLALLGNFYFFKTGHQAVLSSIQWDSAFIPLFTIRYPWSPLVVMLNTFAGQILAAVSVPLIVLWKVGPKRRGVLENVSRAWGVFVAYFAVESLATMLWAGWLRRHLMLYRVFSPRFMTAAIVLLIVDVVGIVVTLTGVRVNVLAVAEVFGLAG